MYRGFAPSGSSRGAMHTADLSVRECFHFSVRVCKVNGHAMWMAMLGFCFPSGRLGLDDTHELIFEKQLVSLWCHFQGIEIFVLRPK